ncbi:hypothetical protein [Thalassobacillus devorans]|uniref:hypothetical protein n=1 Tax=Thalassobacillus devorans TaxID=279813 RepID=UPI00159337B2|nr:hypothetical protein [Thalassobacillus devorans]
MTKPLEWIGFILGLIIVLLYGFSDVIESKTTLSIGLVVAILITLIGFTFRKFKEKQGC